MPDEEQSTGEILKEAGLIIGGVSALLVNAIKAMELLHELMEQGREATVEEREYINQVRSALTREALTPIRG